MSIADFSKLIGGVALFLFGMNLMGDALKKVAGNKLELILYRLSSNAFKGILLGTGVTAVIQSSSATSIMVVGFVNSGMMKIRQAVSIIMGAIIGTSITGWIICLSSIGSSGIFELLSTDSLTAVLALIGIILLMFTKKESNHNTAGILLGFCVLMFGIGAMTDAVYPLRESEVFIHLLTTFENPVIGIVIGMLFTCIIQSASAAVGILQALAVTGAISFRLAFPIIMGIAIGASVPVLLSALGANANGKRTALVYLLVDTIGVIIVSIVFYLLNGVLDFSFMNMTMNMASIALLNTVFRIVVVAVLGPFSRLLEKIVCALIRDDSQSAEDLKDVDRLEERFLAHPALSIEQTKITVNSMAQLTKENFFSATALLESYSETGLRRTAELEDVIDTYEDKLGRYIVKIMNGKLSHEQTMDVSKYLHSINDFERISDHAKNISESVKEMHEKNIHFTDAAEKEMRNLVGAVSEIVSLAVDAFTKDDTASLYRIEPLEEVIDILCDQYKVNHVERIQRNECQYEHGFVFNDMLTDFERIGDHCSNIGIAIKMDNDENIEEHEAASLMEYEKEHGFDKYYKEYLEKYQL